MWLRFNCFFFSLIFFFHLCLDSVLGNVNDSHFLVVVDSNYVGALKLQQVKKRKKTKRKKKCGSSCLGVCCSIVCFNTFDDDRSTTMCLFSRWKTLKSWTKILKWTSADKAPQALHEITFAINQLNVETV